MNFTYYGGKCRSHNKRYQDIHECISAFPNEKHYDPGKYDPA